MKDAGATVDQWPLDLTCEATNVTAQVLQPPADSPDPSAVFCADDTPITFISMPNPRRKARYRLLCYYCGRHTEMNWPPPEAKR